MNKALPLELAYKITPTTLSLWDEVFVQNFAVSGDAVDAYKIAYPAVSSRVRHHAMKLLARPEIVARLREHQEAITKIPMAKSAARLVFELEEMVDADPNELIQVRRVACMGCWPAREQHEEPNEDCQACKGDGERRAYMADTTKVSAGARRLIKSVELGMFGEIKKLVLHDQMAARVELHRLKGMHVERSLNVNANMNIPSVAEIVKDPIEMEKYLDSLQK